MERGLIPVAENETATTGAVAGNEDKEKKPVKSKKDKSLLYKGKPLVRSGNTIYYGYMNEPYVAMLQIMDSKPFSDSLELPQKVSVQILSTDADLRPKERVKKRTEKNTLYDAINIASIWLERTLENR